MNTFRKVALAVAVSAVALTSTAAVRVFQQRSANFTFANSALVPLNSLNQNVVTFNNSGAGRKVLTFSAECAVEGGASSWLDIDVIVNGAAIAPSAGAGDAFCSGAGSSGVGDGWVRASMTLVIPVRGGSNTISINARTNNATTGWIGDSSLVVHD